MPHHHLAQSSGVGRTLRSPRADARCSSLQEHPGHFHKCKASGSFLSPGLEESGKSGHCGFQKTLPEVCRIMAASGPVTAWGPGQVSFDTRASAEGLPEAAWLPEAGPARLWARVPTPVPWARPQGPLGPASSCLWELLITAAGRSPDSWSGPSSGKPAVQRGSELPGDRPARGWPGGRGLQDATSAGPLTLMGHKRVHTALCLEATAPPWEAFCDLQASPGNKSIHRKHWTALNQGSFPSQECCFSL